MVIVNNNNNKAEIDILILPMNKKKSAKQGIRKLKERREDF